ncbi:hypothetical protein M758_4G136400, partial [Ceratodon purpureus]
PAEGKSLHVILTSEVQSPYKTIPKQQPIPLLFHHNEPIPSPNALLLQQTTRNSLNEPSRLQNHVHQSRHTTLPHQLPMLQHHTTPLHESQPRHPLQEHSAKNSNHLSPPTDRQHSTQTKHKKKPQKTQSKPAPSTTIKANSTTTPVHTATSRTEFPTQTSLSLSTPKRSNPPCNKPEKL